MAHACEALSTEKVQNHFYCYFFATLDEQGARRHPQSAPGQGDDRNHRSLRIKWGAAATAPIKSKTNFSPLASARRICRIHHTREAYCKAS